MEDLVAQGRLCASEFVIQELGVKGDPLFDWAQNQKLLHVYTTQQIANDAAAIVAQFPDLIEPNSRRTEADPFVIAAAKNSSLIVVTQETPKTLKTSKRRQKRTYIADVCTALSIPWISFLEMIQREKWTF
jgi:uncharacterized protein DUF4411